MAESISEAGWKAYTKKQKLELDDGALLKALARFDKTDIAKPEPRLQALDDVVEQAKKQVLALAKKKKELGDKPFNETKDKLYELIDSAEKLVKETRAAVAAAESAEEEADTPALLTSKMLPLVRELRKGGTTMHALIGTAGKNTAVLIMRRPVSNSRRKLIGEAIDAAGGARYIAAECMLEEKALTFIVKSQAAGLAKRLREALLAQLALRLKVRVRGEDPKDLDVGGEDEDEAADEARAQAPQDPKSSQAQAEAAPSAQELAYKQQFEQVSPKLAAALRAQHPESTKLRGVAGYASEKAAAGDYATATKGLLMLEKLLDAAPSGAGQATATQAPATPSQQPPTATATDPVKQLQSRAAEVAAALTAAGKAGHPLAGQLKSRLAATLSGAQGAEAAAAALKVVETIGRALAPPADKAAAANPAAEQAWKAAGAAWRQAIETVDAQINAVRSKMLASGNPDLLQIADRGLPALTDNHKTPVMRALFDVDGSTGEARRSAAAKGRVAVQAFAQHIRGNAMVKVLDSNAKAAFGVELSIAPLIGKALDGLDEALGQLLAA